MPAYRSHPACFCWVRNTQAVQALIALFLAVKFSFRGLPGGPSLKGDGQVVVWDGEAFASVQTLCLFSCSHEALGLAILVCVYVYIGSLGE